MKHLKFHSIILTSLFCLVASSLFLIPFVMTKGSMYGDDLHFHIMRMEGLSNVFTSPVNFKTFYNTGQAINLFYPFLLYYPYFIIYKLLSNFWLAWVIYLFLLTNLTFFIAYYSAKKISNSSFAGVLFAMFYGFSAYRSHNILIRFAVGEFISSAILPLVFLGLYIVIKSNGKKWTLLALGMTLLIYSHVMSSVITAAILTVISLITFFHWEKKVNILVGIIKAATLTILLTAAFWLPMLEQFKSIKISGVTKLASNLQSLPLKEVLTVNFKNDITSHNIGIVFILLVIYLATRYKFFSNFEKLVWWLGIFFWVSTTNLLNWDSLNFLHRGFVQLPWRFNTYALLFISFISAVQLAKNNHKLLKLLPIAIAALHILSTYTAVRKIETAPVSLPWAEFSSRNDYNSLTRSVFVPDYTNAVEGFNDNISPLDPRWKVVQREFFMNNTYVPSQQSYTPNQARFKVFNQSSDEVTAYLPVYFYKGQQVTVNGVKVPSKVSEWASTQITLPPGKNNIVVTYSYTIIARLAHLITLITIISSIFLYYKRFIVAKRQEMSQHLSDME